MDLMQFLADTCRAQAEQYRVERALGNLQHFTEQLSRPVPTVAEQERIVEVRRAS